MQPSLERFGGPITPQELDDEATALLAELYGDDWDCVREGIYDGVICLKFFPNSSGGADTQTGTLICELQKQISPDLQLTFRQIVNRKCKVTLTNDQAHLLLYHVHLTRRVNERNAQSAISELFPLPADRTGWEFHDARDINFFQHADQFRVLADLAYDSLRGEHTCEQASPQPWDSHLFAWLYAWNHHFELSFKGILASGSSARPMHDLARAWTKAKGLLANHHNPHCRQLASNGDVATVVAGLAALDASTHGILRYPVGKDMRTAISMPPQLHCFSSAATNELFRKASDGVLSVRWFFAQI